MKTLIALVAIFCGSFAFAEGQGGSGGGVTKKDGRWMTFYSAGLYVEPTNDVGDLPQPIPAEIKLEAYIEQLPYLSDTSKSVLLNAIVPTSGRHYYIASADKLTPAIKEQLLKEYQRITALSRQNLDLAAITDTEAKNTFLLPRFNDLDLADQMTNLFHENYWILHPNATYDEVVAAEKAFEAALKEPSNPARIYDFARYVDSGEEAHHAVAEWELKQGNLNGFLTKDGRFTLERLVGEDFLKCTQRNGLTNLQFVDSRYGQFYGETRPLRNVCYPYFRSHLNILIMKYPSSMLMKAIMQKMDFYMTNVYTSIDTNDGVIEIIKDPHGRIAPDPLKMRGWDDFKRCVVSILAPTGQNTSCPAGKDVMQFIY